MKSIIFTLACIFFHAVTFYAQDQSFKIKWGEEHKGEDRGTVPRIIGSEGGNFYVFERELGLFKDQLFFKYYDNNLSMVKREELDFHEGNFEQDSIQPFFSREHQLWLLGTYKDKSRERICFVAQRFDKQQLKKVGSFKMAEMPYLQRTYIRFSNDSSKVVVVGYHKGKWDDKSAKFSLTVFSDNMEKLWSRRITLPYEQHLLDIENVCVDNAGRVVFLAKLYKEARSEREEGLVGKSNYKFLMLRFKDDGEDPDLLKLDLGGNVAIGTQIMTNKAGNYVCMGLYAIPRKGGFFKIEKEDITGAFYAEMDSKTGVTIEKKLHKFSVEELTKDLAGYKKEKVKKKLKNNETTNELANFYIKRIIQRSDGGFIILAEQYFVLRRSSGGLSRLQGPVTYTYTSFYLNIMAINISSTGTIEWATVIPKHQSEDYADKLTLSFASALVGDNIQLIFNDNKANLEIGENRVIARSIGAHEALFSRDKYEPITILVTIDKAGKASRQALFSIREESLITVPRSCMQISPNEFVLLARNSKKDLLARESKKQRFAIIKFE